MTHASTLEINYTKEDFSISDLSNSQWDCAIAVEVTTYWSGELSPLGRAFAVRLLWSDAALYVRFEAEQNEPPVVNNKPDLSQKTWQLWDRDVCEIFIAPDRNEPRKYFEFEVAPTAEWLDLAIDSTSGERTTDRNYHSGMEAAAKIEEHRVVMGIRIPWKAFGQAPSPGDVWLGNVFRCVGRGPHRGYLAWRPTMTERPNFHVPERFGEFKFGS